MKRMLAVLVAVTLALMPTALLAQQPQTVNGQVGPARYGDGEKQPPRLGTTGETIVGELNGKYYESTRRGLSFIYSTASAGVLLAATTTTFFGPQLHNPCGSGRDLQITKVVVADVSGATARGHLAYFFLTNAGSQAATGSAILTQTLVTPVNALIGSGVVSTMRWSPAVGTYTTAPTYLAPMGPNVIATAPGQTIMMDDIDGRIVVPPCNAFFVGANAAVTMTATVTIYGIENPIPLMTQP